MVDLGEFVLTFAPGTLAGAAGGRFGRQVVPRNLAPELNLGRLTAGKSVILADGATLARLGEDELAAFTRWGDGLHWDVARGTGPARAYQVRIYREREPLVSRPGQPRVYADGLNHPYGSLGDAKFRGSASSFYDPSSLHPSIQHVEGSTFRAYLDLPDPPGDVTLQLFEWGPHPRVTPQTTVQDLLAIGP